MTDWQIDNLLCELIEEEKEVVSYPELFTTIWKMRGYNESEISQIYQWRVTENLDDVVVWNKMVEAGFARES